MALPPYYDRVCDQYLVHTMKRQLVDRVNRIVYTSWSYVDMNQTVPDETRLRLRDQIENEILTGAMPPGYRLDEVSLATRFGWPAA